MPAAPKPSTLPSFGNLSNWAISTFYALGRRVVANGNVYQVTTQGTSAGVGTGPSGTGGAIADGTVVWAFQAAVSTAWAATTGYTLGDIVSNDGGKLYQALNSAISAGSGGPTGTGGVISDGTMLWAYTGTVLGQQTTPTTRVADAGFVPGAPFFSQYVNWFFGLVTLWLYYVRDLADQVWVWTAAHTFNAVVTFTKGIVVTNSTTNGKGVDATGNGNADGVRGTGGSSSGTGVVGVGGSTDGVGVDGTGSGGGAGVIGTGGAGGIGVIGLGGTGSDFPGVYGLGGSTNGDGVKGQPAGGTGVGVRSTNHITADAGDITASAGYIIGDRLYPNGGTVATGEFSISAAWGDTASKSNIAGSDSRGQLTVTCNGASIAMDPSVTFTYKDGNWGTLGWINVWLADTNDTALTRAPMIASGLGNGTVTWTMLNFTPTAGKFYTFRWHTLGEI